MAAHNRNWLQEGLAHSQAGHWLDAVASYRNALTDNPRVAEAHFNLGFALQTLGRRDDAITAYRNAATLKADLAQAHSNLGNIYLSLNRLEEAEECYRKALAASPDLTQAHCNLGLVLRGSIAVQRQRHAFAPLVDRIHRSPRRGMDCGAYWQAKAVLKSRCRLFSNSRNMLRLPPI